MNDKTKPLFRKAGRGYNKEDVNSYIAEMSNAIAAVSEREKNIINESNARAKEDYDTIVSLRSELDGYEALKAEKDELEISLSVANTELKRVYAELEEKNKTPEIPADVLKKAEEYDKIASRAGEVLMIARKTADDILRRANEEAERIVSDANSKKNIIFRNISDTTSSATTNLSDYIQTAVDDCLYRITESINKANKLATNETKHE